jgi:hypothetical protein
MKLLFLLPLLAVAAAIPQSARTLPRTTPTDLSVESFTRNCTAVDSCDYKFIIDYSPYGKAACTIHDVQNDPNVKAKDKEFYGVGCIEVTSPSPFPHITEYTNDKLESINLANILGLEL